MVTNVIFVVISVLTFLSLCSLSTVSNSFYVLLLFSIIFPNLSRSLLISRSPPVALFLASLLSPPSWLLIYLLVFHLPLLSCDQPISTYSSPIFLKVTLKFHSSLHSQFVQSSLIRSLHSNDSSYSVGFANLHLFLLYLCYCRRL